jgi:biotin transport system substrate-specific component
LEEENMQNTLVANIWPQISTNWLIKALVVVLGTVALTISAKLKVPFYPVPMTMQVFVVLVLGLVLGFRLGIATVMLYLAEGAFNLPVFAGTPERGLGLAYMVGPTGGYLLGYLLAVGAVGWLAEWGWAKRLPEAAALAFFGLLLIYIPGLLWLGAVLGWDKPIFEYGFTPFILGDIVKVLVAALLVTGIWQWRGAKPRS